MKTSELYVRYAQRQLYAQSNWILPRGFRPYWNAVAIQSPYIRTSGRVHAAGLYSRVHLSHHAKRLA